MTGRMINGRLHSTKSASGNQYGFTLLELLIGTFAAALLSYAALSLYVTQHEQMLVQDEIADMQANLRSSAEILATTIRLAGYNAPKQSAIECRDSNPDTITVTFDSAALQNVQLSENLLSLTGELVCAGSDLSGVNQDEWYYIYDPISDTGEFFVVTGIAFTNRILHDNSPLTKLYPANSKIIKMNRIRFFVNQPDTSSSNLMMQTFGSGPQVFAENIVDLDFRYFLDNGAVVAQTANPDKIRLVEINIEGRTASRDPQFSNQYRTRDFSLRVNVRNLGLTF